MTKFEQHVLDTVVWVAASCIVVGAFLFRTWAGFVVMGLVLGAFVLLRVVAAAVAGDAEKGGQ